MELRVLLVAPDVANVDGISEIRTITGLHRVTVLNGHVSARDVYDAARLQKFDIIHFAMHSDSDVLKLNGDVLTPESVSQISRLAGAHLLFFNSCLSGRHASYAVQRSTDFAIYANIQLPDAIAWKMPLTFYEFLADQEGDAGTVNYPKAFNDAMSGDGNYGITSAYDRVGVLPLQQRMDGLEHSQRVQFRLILAMFILGALQFMAWLTEILLRIY